MFSCGSNVFGQCGVPSLSENEHITRFTLAEIDDSVKSKIDTIICKFAHSGFVTSDRELYCCGRNHDSEIGIQNIDIVNKFSKVVNIPPVKLVDFAWKYTVIVTTDNEIFSSKCGILKTHSSLNPCIGKYEGWNSSNCEIIKLQCGNEHTVFLTSNMGLYGFGYSLHGEIGTSKNSIIKEIVRIDTYDRIVDEVTDFVTSYNQLIIFTSSGIIYVSGSNTKGQLNYFPSNDDNHVDCFKNPTKAYQSRFFNSACIANQFTILFHTTEGQSDTEKRFKIQMYTLVSHVSLTDLTILF